MQYNNALFAHCCNQRRRAIADPRAVLCSVRSKRSDGNRGYRAIGPLKGIKVLEFAGLGATPFAGMMVADMGADVLRIERPASGLPAADHPMSAQAELLGRSRSRLTVDLKSADGVEFVLRLVESADALIEGFRPGVMERLGLGPDVCCERNPRLVYGRLTGWGQHGPLARSAGHDINYIALAGALDLVGRRGEPPVPPANLVGDFGGGGMLLAFGLVCALLERGQSGRGQVIDAAMVDGAALLTTLIHELRSKGIWQDERGTNLFDTGAHFYEVYETADGQFISVGPLEPQFYEQLIDRLGLDPVIFGRQMDRGEWPALKQRLAAIFKTRTRDEWCTALEGTDVCFSPVLSLAEAPAHHHNKARGTFVDVAGNVQPGPAPRFSRTQPDAPQPPPRPGQNSDDSLIDWGLTIEEFARLRERDVIS